MEQGLLHFHNFMRWMVLLFLLLTFIRALLGLISKSNFSNGDRKAALFLMICADIQLLLGLALYFMKGWWRNLTAGGDVMSNPALRFWSIEHMAGMLIGIIFIHLGYASIKKNISDRAKYNRLFWFTLLAMIVIIITIPWPFRELIGRPLFPGMSV